MRMFFICAGWKNMLLEAMLIGLGNPGKEYAHTRHNAGFMLVDEFLALAERLNPGGTEKLASRHDFDLWRVRLKPIPALPWLLLKPLTYMNQSGLAAVQALSYYHSETDTLIVAHDEMDLPLGRMRFKLGGGAAGHKGVISLEQHLGSGNFYRLRLGIGRPQEDGALKHVLGTFNKIEKNMLLETLRAACAELVCFKETGFETMRQNINSFRADKADA
jgi:PTH1 family peptidyl-tRNA hydrolase